jgi:hypothetical protein
MESESLLGHRQLAMQHQACCPIWYMHIEICRGIKRMYAASYTACEISFIANAPLMASAVLLLGSIC